MVRSKDEPAVHRFRDDGPVGTGEAVPTSGPQAVQDRAIGVRGHEEAAGAIVIAREELREPVRGPSDALHVDVTRGPDPGPLTVGDQLESAAMRGPREHRGRADHPARDPLAQPPGIRSIEDSHDPAPLDDPAHGLPVEFRGKRATSDDHGRLGPRVVALDGTGHGLPSGPGESVDGRGRDLAALGERPDRLRAHLPHPTSRPMTDPETGRERRVAPGLPRHVRVQPHQTGVADQVEPEPMHGLDHLGEREGRAPSGRSVRVVYADPDGPSPPGGSTMRASRRRRRRRTSRTRAITRATIGRPIARTSPRGNAVSKWNWIAEDEPSG